MCTLHGANVDTTSNSYMAGIANCTCTNSIACSDEHQVSSI